LALGQLSLIHAGTRGALALSDVSYQARTIPGAYL
jgi:hypothetical protein